MTLLGTRKQAKREVVRLALLTHPNVDAGLIDNVFELGWSLGARAQSIAFQALCTDVLPEDKAAGDAAEQLIARVKR